MVYHVYNDALGNMFTVDCVLWVIGMSGCRLISRLVIRSWCISRVGGQVFSVRWFTAVENNILSSPTRLGYWGFYQVFDHTVITVCIISENYRSFLHINHTQWVYGLFLRNNDKQSAGVGVSKKFPNVN